MTLTFPFFDLSNILRNSRATQINPTAPQSSENETAYAEREFLRELMARNPEAIQSDLGMMALMTQYPHHF